MHLFNQYTRANYSCEHEDLLNIRKEILDRFQIVIKQLEQTIDSLQAHQISDDDVKEFIDQPLIKEVSSFSFSLFDVDYFQKRIC